MSNGPSTATIVQPPDFGWWSWPGFEPMDSLHEATLASLRIEGGSIEVHLDYVDGRRLRLLFHDVRDVVLEVVPEEVRVPPDVQVTGTECTGDLYSLQAWGVDVWFRSTSQQVQWL